MVALDSDPKATDAAKQNLVLNKLKDLVEVCQDGLEVLEVGSQFNLIVANLDTKTLSPLFGTLRGRTAPRGRLIASGIPVEDEERITTAARTARLLLISRRAEDGWLCLTLAAC
jgi:ribosomal protein L11 methylase PrmA